MVKAMSAKAEKAKKRNSSEKATGGKAKTSLKTAAEDVAERLGIDLPWPAEEAVQVDVGRDPLDFPGDGKDWNLRQKHLFLNRELTWLNFSRRVLFEAENPQNPLLERVRFLAIVAGTLDEFFMKRIGGLKQVKGAGIRKLSVDGRTPGQQINECYAAVKQIEKVKTRIFRDLSQELAGHDIYLLSYDDLSDDERKEVRRYFLENIFPLVTPQVVDAAHPFPFISNLSLNLLVQVRHPRQEGFSMARVKVPIGPDFARFIPVGKAHRFFRLEEAIARNLDVLFPSVEIGAFDFFRVTRNANTEKDEEKAEDLLEMIELELRERKFAPIVRLQVVDGIRAEFKEFLCGELQLAPEDVFHCDRMLGRSDLMEIADLDMLHLRYKPHRPIVHPRFKDNRSFFEVVRREGPVFLYHPYESFTLTVEQFVREASLDPQVRAIKTVLYRTSKDTRIIGFLRDAAQNGKQVTVVVELKARFDEAANIRWANQLEEAGIHVTYGVVGFKTHSKVILVIRKDEDGLRRYCHVGTGNYHAGTARLYCDMGLLIYDQEIGHDLSELFNYLTTGLTPGRQFRKTLVAPSNMKRELLEKIHREISHHRAGSPGVIQMKLNALEDVDLVKALYEASREGVSIDLIVRDTCRLRPGLKGLSDHIRVLSVIGRFLEHARVYYFRNAGAEEYFVGSADAMRRNLERRVELLVPVEDTLLKRELRTALDLQLSDVQHSWIMAPDGSYLRRRPTKATGASAQTKAIEICERRAKVAHKPKRLNTKGKSKKELWAGHQI